MMVQCPPGHDATVQLASAPHVIWQLPPAHETEHVAPAPHVTGQLPDVHVSVQLLDPPHCVLQFVSPLPMSQSSVHVALAGHTQLLPVHEPPVADGGGGVPGGGGGGVPDDAPPSSAPPSGVPLPIDQS